MTDTDSARQESHDAGSDVDWGMAYAPEEDQRSPERIAYEAYQRGDQLLQLDLPVAWVQGAIGLGTTATRLRRGERIDILGAVEAQGWRLQMMSTTFVQTGSSATKRMFANAGSTEVAMHGTLVGVYVFRRADKVS